MSTKLIKKQDALFKQLFSHDDVFADIVNAVLFQGEQVVSASDIQNEDTDVSCFIEGYGSINRNRDSLKKVTVNGIHYLIGIEHQSHINKYMGNRVRLYDALTVHKHITQKKELYHVVTIVLYVGEKRWEKNKNFDEMIGNKSHLLEEYATYKMLPVVDLGDYDYHLFNGQYMYNLTKGIQAIYQWDMEKIRGVKLEKEAALILSTLAGNEEIYNYIEMKKEDDVDMCKSFELFERRSIEKGVVQGIKQGVVPVSYTHLTLPTKA